MKLSEVRKAYLIVDTTKSFEQVFHACPNPRDYLLRSGQRAYTFFDGRKFGTSELLSVLNFRLKIEIKDWEEIAEKDIEMLYNLCLF